MGSFRDTACRDSICSRILRKEIVNRFRAAAPLVEFLNRPLVAQAARPVALIDFF